jgi:hypothetical protein
MGTGDVDSVLGAAGDDCGAVWGVGHCYSVRRKTC